MIFLIVLIGVIFLSMNRFLMNFSNKEVILYDFFGRNFLEHFFWGFGLPTLLLIFSFGVESILGRKRDNKSWNFPYFLSLIAFIISDASYYCVKEGIQSTEWIKFIFGDILGFILGSLFLFKLKKDAQKNN